MTTLGLVVERTSRILAPLAHGLGHLAIELRYFAAQQPLSSLRRWQGSDDPIVDLLSFRLVKMIRSVYFTFGDRRLEKWSTFSPNSASLFVVDKHKANH